MTNFVQRYADGDDNTAGAFPFDTIADVDYPITKLLFGAEGSVTYVSAAAPLPVTMSGASTAANQATGNDSLSSIDGKITAVNTGAVVVASSALPSGASTAANQTTAIASLASIDGKITAVNTGAVVVSSSALPSGASTAANQSTANTALSAIQTAVQLIDNAISGSEMQVDVVAALPAGTNNIGDVDVLTVPADPFGANADAASATGSISAKLRFIASTGIPITGTVTVGSHAVTNAGTFAVQVSSIAAGDNNIGNVDVVTLPALPAGTNLIGKVTETPATSDGLTAHVTISAASTNATSVKGSAGKLYSILASNVNAAARYLKLYNKATAPTVGTDTPVHTLIIPGNAAGAGFAFTFPNGLEFTTGIAFAITSGVAHADTGAVSASEHAINLGYK